jgi:23S rRNA (pseudouridine1915-N3)-methyltransferase
MKIFISAVGHRMPAWVEAGFHEYSRRMPREMSVELIEVRPERRLSKSLTPAAVRKVQTTEGTRMLASLPAGCRTVALDESGKLLGTVQLARQLERWALESKDVAFLIGGTDGLAESVKKDASLMLSLSPLTMPHQLVRVLIAEQLYRCMSLLRNHPYHRE